ncbi:MAG: NAD(P)/FAD-dependent oxidoreductase, partial [Rhodospirillales bacterium]|nr:NAD(P)/FAD-dependent oxidoreductase [Rhodospirillales bacterium]
MSTTIDLAIIGAGPYGLSLAAHLSGTGLDVTVFGQPMQFWRDSMPNGMVLKSEGFASDLWHPDDALTLRDFCRSEGLPYQHAGLPVPLETFCHYGLEFQRRFVPNLDPRLVAQLDHERGRFVLRFHTGQTVVARQVVLAVGIGLFPEVPAALDAIGGPCCGHSSKYRDLDRFAGQEVLVIGGGASGVEMAALISQAGGRATVAARHERIGFCGAPAPRSLLDRLRAPQSGLGTGWRSWACVTAPWLFHRMPRDFRHMIVRRHLGPAPGWTARAEIERNVTVVLRAEPTASRMFGARPSVTFSVAGEGTRTITADHVIAATGYQAEVARLG